MNYVVIEGLPAVGKSETLELLARFYPHQVRVLPELVKTIILNEDIDLFSERARLTEAIRKALPERRRQIHEIVSQGFLCLEESHLGVHYAYSAALGDRDFIELYPSIAAALPTPDAYIRMDIPVSASLDRQLSRGTAQFDVDGQALGTMLSELDRWHASQPAPLLHVDADAPVNQALADLVQHLNLDYNAPALPNEETLDIILLLGRPASGKSEFIDFMTRISSDHRAREFFIAPFQIIDDFPILWDLFQQDDVWESVGRERLFSRHSDGNYAVADDSVWGFLIEQIKQRVLASPSFTSQSTRRTLIIEFSRGGSTGYADALSRLSPAILKRAVALYVSVSFEESWRRNIARYDAKKRDGILTHSVPREEMERTYGTDDWHTITDGASGLLRVGDIDVPYATMNNEPESKVPDVLAGRYRAALSPLFALRQKNLAARQDL
jgi:thymidylate kinase